MIVLAGDIGGTNARLAGYEVVDAHLHEKACQVYPCERFSSLEDVVADFMQTTGIKPLASCLGVAGPVLNGRAQITNLPWQVSVAALGHVTQSPSSALLNDLEATAYGIFALMPEDVAVLQEGSPQMGNACVIAAGTGLGEAGLVWSKDRYLPLACEGGHASFGPTTTLQMELLAFLHERFGHVSWERVVSGQGLVNIYSFTRHLYPNGEPQWLTEKLKTSEAAEAISIAGQEQASKAAEMALELFIHCYAAEAGNLALKMMARNGVYLAGGIAPKLLSSLRQPSFLESFTNKGRMGELLKAFPVRVITNEKVSLMGAAWFAAFGAGVQTPLT